MNTKPRAKIAIITRTKNRNLLLPRALESVLNQTYKDYIHVIVNDGGDNIELDNILTKKPDSNRVVIHNKKSIGLVKALNQGIQAADSDYICILDDDDSWNPDRLKMVVEYLDNNKSAGVVVPMMQVIEKIEDNKIIELERSQYIEDEAYINLYKQCLDNYLSNGCFNYKRSIYDELKGYDESLDVAEDWDFGIRFLMKYDVDFVNSPEPLMYYHQRPQQIGDHGNSVFAGVNVHKSNLNKLKNKYLRADLLAGKMGIGYIMNDLAYRRDVNKNHEDNYMNGIVRIEGHINLVGNEIKADIAHLNDSKITNRIKRKIVK